MEPHSPADHNAVVGLTTPRTQFQKTLCTTSTLNTTTRRFAVRIRKKKKVDRIWFIFEYRARKSEVLMGRRESMCVKRKERETDEQIQTNRAKEEVDGCLPPAPGWCCGTNQVLALHVLRCLCAQTRGCGVSSISCAHPQSLHLLPQMTAS